MDKYQMTMYTPCIKAIIKGIFLFNITIRRCKMRLIQLEYLTKIAECGSITKAAQELYISQPSLTKSIANLEAEYNIQLLKRTPKGISLTPKGREFLEYAQDVLDSRHILESTFQKEVTKSPQRLCIASQQFDFTYNLLEYFYKQNNMALAITVEELDRGSIIEHIEKRLADIGILVLNREDNKFLETTLRQKALEVHELDTSSVYVCMSKSSPLYEKKELMTSDTASCLHVALDMDKELRRQIIGGKMNESIDQRQVIFCNTINACLHFMRHTGALLYVPRWVLGLVQAESDIRVVPLKMNDGKPWPAVNRLVWIKRENEELSMLESKFVHLVTKMFSGPFN